MFSFFSFLLPVTVNNDVYKTPPVRLYSCTMLHLGWRMTMLMMMIIIIISVWVDGCTYGYDRH